MCRLYHSPVAIYALLCLGVYASCLCLHIFVVDDGRSYLLVTIAGKLVEERLQGIKMFFLGSLNLQFVVDEKFHIFLYRLLVDDTFGVVLVIRIFEFRLAYRLSVNLHDDRVGSLSKSHAATKQHKP